MQESSFKEESSDISFLLLSMARSSTGYDNKESLGSLIKIPMKVMRVEWTINQN